MDVVGGMCRRRLSRVITDHDPVHAISEDGSTHSESPDIQQ